MCVDCWESYGAPTTEPAFGPAIRMMIRDLYTMERCGVGGPLHSVLDDWNLEDEHLTPWVDPTDPWPAEVLELAQRICDVMLKLSLTERAAVLAAHNFR